MLNQGGALVNIYMDGSVVVNHGGTEMGQGLNTKMAQVATDALGVDFKLVRVTATDTQKVPNASATAASSGADINGAAVANACGPLRERLQAVAANMLGCEPSNVRIEGGQAMRADGSSDQVVAWKDLAKQAWLDRVSLSSSGFYMTPDIAYDFMTLQGKAFYYFCYGAAVTETEIDTRTGEWWLTGVDIVHDVGQSINPAIDKGQIEGAYVQGMGWLTMEEIIWDKKGMAPAPTRSRWRVTFHRISMCRSLPIKTSSPRRSVAKRWANRHLCSRCPPTSHCGMRWVLWHQARWFKWMRLPRPSAC